MTLPSGSRLGPYEILSPLGAGGMGEVYRAKDPRLGREVAIKVLPSSFSQDADRLRRFEQEARAAGILNHPNITAVYDIGSTDGAPYVVSELLEGETLRSALAGGKLSIRKATDYALQIANGLAAAHEKGIVHRDLKPENLFVTKDGRVKILDFGLAKLTHTEEGSQGTNLPTASAGTEPGVVMGTLGYMSPEQVRGRSADARSDLFSFGAILYEMLSGDRAFRGDSAADTMSAILKEDPPDLSVTNRSVPPGLERIVRHCLEKNPEQRFHSAHDVAFALEALSTTSAPAAAISGGRPKIASRAPGRLAAAAAAFLALGVLVGRLTAPSPTEPPEIRPLTYSGHDSDPAASPDGHTVAFTSDRDGRQRIWLKQVVGGNEVALTEGPGDHHPRFSPDGSSILFTRTREAIDSIYRVPTVGGEPRRLFSDAREGDWSPDGSRIAFLRSGFATGFATDVAVGASDGSGARTIIRLATGVRRPRWTPDGTAIVAIQGPGAGTTPGVIQWIRSDGGEHRVIEPPERRGELSSVSWSSNGMVYMQGAQATSLARAVTGRVFLQKPGSSRARVLLNVSNLAGSLDVLAPGRLVFDSDSSHETIREVSLAGATKPEAPRWITRGTASDRQPLYSPDGKRLLFASDRGGNLDIWEIALATGAVRRLTDDPSEDWDPALSPDGKYLLWSSDRSGHFEIWIADADGSDPRRVTNDGLDAENPEMTPDGQWITYTSSNPPRRGLWKIHPDGTGDTQLVKGSIAHPEVSPDGRYVLYHLATRSAQIARVDDGRVLPFSIDLRALGHVGRSRWLPDGKSLAFLGVDAQMRTGVFAQEFSAEAADTSASRRPLAGFDPNRPTESFAFSPDGSRIALAEIEVQGNILIADGVPGVDPPRRGAR